MAYENILFDVSDGVAKIVLNRPGAANSLNGGLAHDLMMAAIRCDEDPDIRAVVLTGAGTMFCTYFTDKEVYNFSDAAATDIDMFNKFFRKMLEKGVNLAPSAFEAGFMSLAHTRSDINRTARAAYESFRELS